MPIRLTDKQKCFADAFVANGGDVKASAVAAGYGSVTPQALRRITGSEALITEIGAKLENEAARREKPSRRMIVDFYLSVMRDRDEKTADRLRAASSLSEMLTDDVPSAEFELPARVVGRSFADINREIRPNVSYIFAGGRGSGKSSFIALKIVELLKKYPEISACIVRKVASTLRDSVYAQMCWAISELGLEGEFSFQKEPLLIVLRSTGQKIFFRGCDDAKKLKSLRPDHGYVGILWKEEMDQFSGVEEVRSIGQSVLRGGEIMFDFGSCNPPKRRGSWMNRLLDAPGEGTVVHRSTYLDVPREWLGTKFLDDAEHLREHDSRAYEHEYLGIATGDGAAVFENLRVSRITDEEIARFDRIYQGVDFGWYPDSYAFLRTHYDAAQGDIYLIDELYGRKKSNAETGAWIVSRGYCDRRIVCDSAEPKSISDYRAMGIPAVGAVKGAGSVEYGFKWLCCRTIVVDPERTPNAYRELSEYEYERGADGEIVGGYPDANDHAISALRYAYEGEARRGGGA